MPDDVVMKQLTTLGGSGGIIAIDRAGNITIPFNSSGMYRGSIDVQGREHIAIFND